MQSPEIELKFIVEDAAALHSRLPALGFHLETPRTFESNTLYDTPTRSLRDAGQILRLRQYGDLWTLTHKRHPDGEDPAQAAASRYKIRVETETTVADGAALREILLRIGLAPTFRYEKFRTEWSDPTTEGRPHLVIDETPIGNFAELEGPPSWIDQTLASLQVAPDRCLTDSYGKLFLDWKQRTGSPAEHLAFADIQPGR
jgi:adenylate cyclase class 2